MIYGYMAFPKKGQYIFFMSPGFLKFFFKILTNSSCKCSIFIWDDGMDISS